MPLPFTSQPPRLLERALPTMAPPTSVTLHFDTRTRVAGEIIHGSVHLDLAKVKEEKVERVTVKLRGIVKVTAIKNPFWSMYPTGVFKNDKPLDRRLSDIILRKDFLLWRARTDEAEMAGTDVLHLPFEFRLPEDLPSSIHGGSRITRGTVSYSVELIVNRRGLTSTDLRSGFVFPVVSTASAEEVDDAKSLKRGWDGSNVDYEHSKLVRKRPGGEQARLVAQLIWPGVHAVQKLLSFPQNVTVPVTLAIITYSNPSQASKTPLDSASLLTDKALFPAPPVDTSAFEVRLDRRLRIRAYGEQYEIREQLVQIGGFRRRVLEPKWIPPTEGGQGCWEIEVHFDSQFIFTMSPNVKSRLVQTDYIVHVHVPLPGHKNDIKWDTLIRINSGTTASAQEETVPAYVDLPPEYFAGGDHNWDRE